MADKTLTALTETTELASGDLFYVVDGGNSRKIDFDNLVTEIIDEAVSAFVQTLLDDADAATARTTLAALGTGGGTMSGALEMGGQTLGGHLGKVVTSVSGTLVAATHSGNILVTSGNVEVPTTTGFCGMLIAGGAHTITFNSTVSAAMASGDIVSFVVQSATVIKAVQVAAADLVAFS